MPVLYVFTWPLYIILYYIVRYRRNVCENNINNSFAQLNNNEKTTLTKKFYKNYAEVALEFLKTIQADTNVINSRIKFENIEVIKQALNADQTIILALAHQCNMEWPILALSDQIQHPIDGIYKPLHQKWLNDLTIKSRSKFNITLIPAKTCITDLIKRSKITRVVAIAPDQAPRRRDDAYWTTFMNQETPFYLGLEKIATLFKHPVYFMQVERTNRGNYTASFKLLCEPPYKKDAFEVSKAYVTAVEEQIHKNPQDWLWLHKRWKKKKSLYNQ